MPASVFAPSYVSVPTESPSMTFVKLAASGCHDSPSYSFVVVPQTMPMERGAIVKVCVVLPLAPVSV